MCVHLPLLLSLVLQECRLWVHSAFYKGGSLKNVRSSFSFVSPLALFYDFFQKGCLYLLFLVLPASAGISDVFVRCKCGSYGALLPSLTMPQIFWPQERRTDLFRVSCTVADRSTQISCFSPSFLQRKLEGHLSHNVHVHHDLLVKSVCIALSCILS